MAEERLTLISGASGFIGGNLARRLCAKGARLRLLVRRESRLDNIRECCGNSEMAYGDLRDKRSLELAVRGCKVVYHVGADYSLWSPRPFDIYRTNVQGTKNMLEAAREARVEKFVYTSSVATMGIPRDGSPGNETTPVSLFDMVGHYKRSKFMAEVLALRFAKEGLPVVVVNPTTPVGPMDIKPTPTGKMIVDFLNCRMPAYLETGLNIIDVDDVAAGHILACERGRVGERYILGNRNISLREIFELLSRITTIRCPRYKIPHWFALALGLIDSVKSKLTGQEPRVPLEGVRMAKKFMYFSSEKAVRELGLPQGDIEEAFRKAVDWFRKNGYVKR